MDEILSKFESTLGNNNAEDSKTSFEGLYKNWGKLGNQEERRKELLEVQKNNRNKKLDYHRGILELVNAVEEENQSRSYRRSYRPSIYVAGFHKVSPKYKNVLMLSEWLIEKPTDFHEEWYVVPCPKGVRLLLVANRGRTKFYTRYGQFKFECRTALPGGNPCDGKMSQYQCCVLDVFYDEKANTVHVLDLLAWNNQPMTDCETEFRQFWLESKFAELPDLKVVSNKNKKIFTILPKVPCTPDNFNQFMSRYPLFECNYPPLDGLLFYHKRAHYVNGETPLVGWLYPYMVPEVFGADIQIHKMHAEKPENYVDQADFIKEFEAKNAKKWKSRQNSANNSANTSVSESQKDGVKLEEAMESSEAAQEEEKGDTMEAEELVEKKPEGGDMDTEAAKKEVSTAEEIAEAVLSAN